MRRGLTILILIVAVALGVLWWLAIPQTIPASALAAYTPSAQNGETVFNAGGCSSCHATPKQDDRLRLGGGLPLTSAFGTFHVPNISPDPNDGIGQWSEADFANAMLRGTSPQRTHLYPSFPYTSYHLAKIEDVRDLFAYLKTLAPVSGRAPLHDLRFPFSVRAAVGVWKLMFFDTRPFAPDAAQSAQWNRGAYLVNGLGHCAECHSPRNALGGIVTAQRFAGGPNPEGKGSVPNITQKGLGDWSDKDIAYFLETGQTPEGDTTGGSMTAVIRNTSKLSADDRTAMATYIKSLKPIDGPPKPAKKE